MRYSLQPTQATAGLYHITQEGVLIAKAYRLRPYERHIVEVVARDEESGEVVKASVDIELLRRGQPVPRSPFGEERFFGDMDLRVAGSVTGVLFLMLVTIMFLLIRWAKRRRQRRDPAGRGSVTLGKHSKGVNSSRSNPLIGEISSFQNETFSMDYEGSEGSGGSAGLQGRHGTYTRKQSLPAPQPGSRTVTGDTLPILVMPEPLVKNLNPALLLNGRESDRNIRTGLTMKDEKERNKRRMEERELEQKWGHTVGADSKRHLEAERMDKSRDVFGASGKIVGVGKATEDQTGTKKPQTQRMRNQLIREHNGRHRSTSEEESEADSQYKTMHSGNCPSDDYDTAAEEELGDRSQYSSVKTSRGDSQRRSSSKPTDNQTNRRLSNPQMQLLDSYSGLPTHIEEDAKELLPCNEK
ncbi:hypothetical protein DPEC_G00107720 [Dallia pectoralis]|uniref:Uncharacterized protein n=1 Tax=Dallia pectoralis TaxID=75939 RepID=A0ACC2GS88_DALPE|nr:hypothetical protein DPEC_G00107720 [Dallia pectoralis]